MATQEQYKLSQEIESVRIELMNKYYALKEKNYDTMQLFNFVDDKLRDLVVKQNVIADLIIYIYRQIKMNRNLKNKLDWKMVLIMFVLLQFVVPLLTSLQAFFIDGENFFQTFKDGLVFCFFFLCLIFYIPLTFKLLK